MPRGLAATADLVRRDTRPAVKAEAFTVMAFMVTADIVLKVFVGGCVVTDVEVNAGARRHDRKTKAATR